MHKIFFRKFVLEVFFFIILTFLFIAFLILTILLATKKQSCKDCKSCLTTPDTEKCCSGTLDPFYDNNDEYGCK